MEKLLKILTILFFQLLIVSYAKSQNDNLSQKSIVKSFYSIEANVGYSGTVESVYPNWDERNIAFFGKALVGGANFSAGVEISHFFKIGAGLGYFYYKQNNNDNYAAFYYIYPQSTTTHGIPLFLYLRSDFLDKKITPYLDFKIGNNFLITKGEVENRSDYSGFELSDYTDFHLKNGLYLAANIGVSFKIKSKLAINTSLGYQYVSKPFYVYSGYYDFFSEEPSFRFSKTKYTIIDHQFMFNIGVSF